MGMVVLRDGHHAKLAQVASPAIDAGQAHAPNRRLPYRLFHDSIASRTSPYFKAAMDKQLLVICSLTFVIHLIGTLAYSVRIAGVRTRRIAVSLALFSILVLVSRTSNSFLGPFLAKRIELSLAQPLAAGHVLSDLRWLLLAATLATLAGAVLIPTFQRVFYREVEHFQLHRSVPKLLLHGVFKGGLSYVKDVAAMPSTGNVRGLRDSGSVSMSVTLLNVGAVAL